MTSINFEIFIKESMLFYSGLCIYEKNNMCIEDIKKILQNNRQYIFDNSSKRGNGYINISSSVLKSITF